MAKTKRAPAETDGWADSAELWSRRAGPHNVTLESGHKVTIRVLGIASLSRLGALPEHLQEIAWMHYGNLDAGGAPAVIRHELSKAELAEQADRHLAELAELHRTVAAAGLIDPVLTPEQLSDPELVPEADLEDLFRLVTGQRQFDSAGIRMGVEPVNAWATFRHEHHCDPDCPACTAALGLVSSVHVDGV